MVDYDKLAYVENSNYRIAVVSTLFDEPQTPSKIARQTNKEMSHISRALTELADKDIAKLLVSEETKRGRLYGLTETGKEVAVKVSERNTNEQVQ